MKRSTSRIAHFNTLAVSFAAKSGTAIGALLCLATFAMQPAHADGVCRPSLQTTQTDFPVAAQHLNQFGTVQVGVRIGTDGRAAGALVRTSSGYPLLDHAAVDSVRKHWRFAIAHCSAEDLRTEHTVAVQFQRTKAVTVAGTVDVQSLATARAMHANPHCQSQSTIDTTVFSCISAPKTVAATEKTQPVVLREASR